MTKKKSIIILSIVFVLTIILAVLDFASFKLPKFIANGTKDYNSISSTIGLGIDLKGGYYVVLTPENTGSEVADDKLYDNAVTILQERLDKKGYTEATITIQGIGDDREIRVEIPEIDNPDEVMKIIGSSGYITFEDKNSIQYLTGEHIKKATAVTNKEDGQAIVILEFTSKGVDLFSQATEKVKGDRLYIKLDGETVSAPSVNDRITSQTAQIENIGSMEEAESLAAVINAGTINIKFTVGESNRISATLGENALKSSVIAGAIGLFIIFLIMILRYRGFGLASSLALLIYTVVFIVLLAIVPWVQLTLPGIAGIILSIGMAVDANVIIFERIREEYANGKTVNSAITAGFKRAFVTIFDGNITTVIAAIVLWILCPGSIKGFAITLFIGIILSMLTAILVSRSLIKCIAVLPKNKAKFFNLKREVEVDA